MHTKVMAKATAWLSERVPDARLSDFAALLEIGSADHPLPVHELTVNLGMPPSWLPGFVARHTLYHGGLSPLVELHQRVDGPVVELSQVGHNILNQFWQRASAGENAETW